MSAAEAPNFTQVPNHLLDEMSRLTPAQNLVLFAICRKTLGYQKARDRISGSQLMQMTGLSHTAIYNAVAALEELGYIAIFESNAGNEYEFCATPDEVDNSVANVDNSVVNTTSPSGQRVDNSVYTQKKFNTYTHIDTNYLSTGDEEVVDGFRILHAQRNEQNALHAQHYQAFSSLAKIKLDQKWGDAQFMENCATILADIRAHGEKPVSEALTVTLRNLKSTNNWFHYYRGALKNLRPAQAKRGPELKAGDQALYRGQWHTITDVMQHVVMLDYEIEAEPGALQEVRAA